MEEIPPESSEDDACGSDDEWLPEKGANDSSSDSGAEDAEDANAEGVEAEAEDVPPNRAQEKKAENTSRNIWKAKDNQFEGELPPFLGEWKVNVEGTEPIHFFMHLFPEELMNEMCIIQTCMHSKKERTILP